MTKKVVFGVEEFYPMLKNTKNQTLKSCPYFCFEFFIKYKKGAN